MLDVLRLLSALESWAMSNKEMRLPDYLHEDITKSVERLEDHILDKA